MFADGFSDDAARHSATQIQRRVLPEAVRWGESVGCGEAV